MPSRTPLLLLAGLLVIAAIATGVNWFVQAIEAGLCESADPSVCEAQDDDYVPWGVASLVLLSSAVLMFLWSRKPSRGHDLAVTITSNRARFRLLLIGLAVFVLLVVAALVIGN